MDKVYDFIVVGGGPAGSVAAAQLAKKKYNVLVIEASSEFKRKVCGEYLCPRGVELLNSIGMSKLIDLYPPVLGMSIVTPDFKVLETEFPKGNCLYNFGLSVNRKNFDQHLIDNASTQGAAVLRGIRTVDIIKKNEFYEVILSDGKVLKCKILVGADGRHSLVAKKLNVHEKQQGERVAIHAIFKFKKDFNNRFGQMHLLEDGSYIGINPTGANELNVSIVLDKAQLSAKQKPLELLTSKMKTSPILNKTLELEYEVIDCHSVYPVTHRVSHYEPDRAILVGDAAGFFDPLTGEGMYYAIWMGLELSKSFEDKLTEESVNKSLQNFYKIKKESFSAKESLNRLFQKVIKSKITISILYKFLKNDKNKRNHFLGIIGNIHTPVEGVKKIILGEAA